MENNRLSDTPGHYSGVYTQRTAWKILNVRPRTTISLGDFLAVARRGRWTR